jgi:hypothetical protein
MGLQTEIAHCGHCAGLMMLRIGIEGCWFECQQCGDGTIPRPTIREADLDVVWVAVQRERQSAIPANSRI